MSTATTRARSLRTRQTEAEKRLWYRLRNRQVTGHKFRRQHPAGPYIVDFFCTERHLAVELDGGQHNTPAVQQRDEERSAFLRSCGIRVLRFWNVDVMENIEGVLQRIAEALQESPLTQPSPPEGGEGLDPDTNSHNTPPLPRSRGRGTG